MGKNTNYPRFINTLPDGNDLLAGSPHKKIATEISNIIKLDFTKEDKDKFRKKIIGLSGEWGSGKSNIVKMLEDECLKDKNKYIHYIYDAWGHQEDLNRRALLEEVEFALNEKKVIDINKGDWKKRHNRLLAKSRTTDKHTYPEIKKYYILLGVAIVLHQVLKSLFGFIDFDIIPNYWIGQKAKEFLVVHLIPLLALFWAIFLGHEDYKETKKNNDNLPDGHKEKLSDSQLLSRIFFWAKGKEIKSYTDEYVIEKEPSSKNFREYFDAFNTALEGKSKTLILYFDNFDRLPIEKIKALWASIHSFFAENSYSNVWVVVPYDESRIILAFKEEGVDNAIAEGMLQKTFSVSFRVTPPLISQWKSLLHQMLYLAFDESHLGGEVDFIEEVYNHQTERSCMTPRNIKNFVNDLVALKIQNPNNRLRYIALFALTKREILENPTEVILKKSYLKKSLYWFKGDELLDENIASLTYGVESKIANEILVKQQVEKIVRGDVNSSSISDFGNRDVFVTYFDEVFSEYCRREFENEPISHIPEVLNEIRLNKLLTKVGTKKYWETLYSRMKGETYFKMITPLLLSIIEELPDKASEIMSKVLELNEALATMEATQDKYLKLLLDIQSLIEDKELGVSLERIAPNISVEALPFLKYISSQETEVPILYNVETEVESINKHFISEDSQTIIENIQPWINQIPFLSEKYDLDIIKETLKEEIESNAPNNITNVQERIDKLRVYRSFGRVFLIKLSPIQHYFQYLKDSNQDDEDKALLLGYCLANVNESYKHQSFINFLNNCVIDVNETVNYVGEFSRSFVSFLIKAQGINNSPAYLKKCVLSYFRRKPGGIYLDRDATNVIDNYNVIISNFFDTSTDRGEFAIWLDKNSVKILNAYYEQERDETPSELIEDIFSQELEVFTKMKQEISNFYVEQGAEEWLGILKDFENLPIGLGELIDEGNKSFVSETVYTSLEEYLQGAVKGEFATFSNSDCMESFFDLLHKGRVRAIFRRVADYFRLHSNQVQSEVIIQLHDQFVKFGRFEDYPDDIAVGVFHRLVSDSELYKQCIKPHLEFYVDIISKAKEYKVEAQANLLAREQDFDEAQLKYIKKKLKIKL